MNGAEVSLSGESLAFVESLYEDYLKDPQSVEGRWRELFQGWNGSGPQAVRPTLRSGSVFNPVTAAPERGPWTSKLADVAARQDKVDQLIRGYRVRGHMLAKLDPLGLPRNMHPELEPSHYSLSEADLDLQFSSRTISGARPMTLRQILQKLTRTYCDSIGVQFMHIDDLVTKEWLQHRMEGSDNRRHLSREEQLRILTRLTDAEIFEDFLQKKFLGAKRFSLEGAETLIPLLDLAIEEAAEHGVEEIVIGMPHRGRLNVLANIMGKSPRQIFREFEDKDRLHFLASGDVKYHMGHSSDYRTASGKSVHLSLCFNPSHLEFVGPVVQGRVRAKQDRRGDADRKRVMAIVIHGDAAIAGQGVVQELFNMSSLPGYTTGGTLHIVVNNQIGFTTPPESSRSSTYATDIAKMLQIPIFHVNGERPEPVAQVVQLAMDFRQEFKNDAVIDMYCYRRYGHNEGDDPAFTQPLMYSAIRQRKSVRESYLESLLELHDISPREGDEIAVRRRHELEDELSAARSEAYDTPPLESGKGLWTGYLGGLELNVPDVKTGVPRAELQRLLAAQARVPEDFHPHPKIVKLLETRMEMADGKRPLDWGGGEALAFATLAAGGSRIRLAGQDTQRGTFSHRHAVLHDYEDGHRFMPLAHLSPSQGPVDIIDSPLSEVGVLGFEYGYSNDMPDGLVLWEAQFGDFANCAQVIIDQFIVSCEDKWKRLSGVGLLLPHGFEGQGPEHSSARLERWLTMAAEDNIQVVNLTTPAQLFHCLRRQVLRPWRKPLIVMSPKSLLRHPEAVSPLEDFERGEFQRILGDTSGTPPEDARRLLLCSGKIYYELASERARKQALDVHIVRLEQLYPLREEQLQAALAAYRDETPTLWVQEEPRNNGAWTSIRMRFGERLLGRLPLSVISRPASASPASGSAGAHKLVQDQIIQQAIGV